MKNTTRRLTTLAVLAALQLSLASSVVAQEDPNDDFLNDDTDFDAPPPGFNPPPPPMPGGAGGNHNGAPGGGFGGANAGGGEDFGRPGAGGAANPGFNSSKARGAKPKFAEAQPEDITNSNFPDLLDSFDYPNAEISDVIKAISELTGKNFIVDPSVRGKITIMAPTRITVAEAYKAFLSALAINGYSIVPSGKFLKIVQGRAAQRDSIEIYSGNYTPNTDQMITRIIQLKHISAAEFNKYLRTLTSKDGNLEVYEPTNTLILSDYGSNVERVQKIVNEIDVAGFEEQLEVIPIRHAKASDIAQLIDQIINKGKPSSTRGGAFTAGIPRFGGNEQKGNNAFSMVIPDGRTNAIIVVGNKAGIQKIRELVRKLDFDIPADEAGGVFVYFVRYGDAKKIAETLSGIAQSASKDKDKDKNNFIPPPPPMGGAPVDAGPLGLSAGNIFGGDVKVTAVTETNSLIIVASKQDFQVVTNLLEKIDIPRNQVYVEAIIMEMGVDAKTNWGINYYSLNGDGGRARAGFVNDGALSNFLNIQKDNGAILSFGGGGTVEVDGPAGKIKIPSLVGFINFLKANTNVNILSTPQIMALDNETASIEVGDTIPTAAASVQGGTSTTTSITREQAYIKLKIEPHISPKSDSIRLKIEQSIKQLSEKQVAAKNLTDSAVVTNDRSVTSNIVVRDGDTAVIGGLMTERESVNINKVPLLGDIPILGWLFKSKSTRSEKVNLLIFITPRVIRTHEDTNKLLTEKLNQRLEFIKNDFSGRDTHGARVEALKKSSKVDQPAAEEKAGEETIEE